MGAGLTRKAYCGVLGSAGWVSCQGLGEPPGVLDPRLGQGSHPPIAGQARLVGMGETQASSRWGGEDGIEGAHSSCSQLFVDAHCCFHFGNDRDYSPH